MTDQLEPFRRMARSMRFFPPLSLNQPSQDSRQEPVIPALGVSSAQWKPLSEARVESAEGPPIDPSEHTAALIREAVEKPTVLPATYAIVENIGDRISRLAPPTPAKSYVFQPKIPKVDYDWTSAGTIEHQVTEADTAKLVNNAPSEASASATVVSPPPVIEETPRSEADAIAAKPTEPVATDVSSQPIVEETSSDNLEAIAVEPVATETTLGKEASATDAPERIEVERTDDRELVASVAEPLEVEQTSNDAAQDNTPVDIAPESVRASEPPAIASDAKKFSDDAREEDSTSTTISAPLTVEEPFRDELVPATVEEILDEEASAVVVEPGALEETSDAESENAAAPTLLERVSAAMEAASTALKHPVADRKESETQEKPAPSEVAANEASADEAQSTQAPSLIQRVSSVVEAAVTAFQHPEIEQKDSDTVTVEETAPSETEEAEVPATSVESVTAEVPVEEAEEKRSPTFLEPVSSTLEVVTTPVEEAVVEQTPVTDETVSDSRTVKVACPKCESVNLRKNGNRQGKQRYVCKDCGKQFAVPDANTEAKQEKLKSSSVVETPTIKNQDSESEFELSTPSKRLGKKKKTKAKGFGK